MADAVASGLDAPKRRIVDFHVGSMQVFHAIISTVIVALAMFMTFVAIRDIAVESDTGITTPLQISTAVAGSTDPDLTLQLTTNCNADGECVATVKGIRETDEATTTTVNRATIRRNPAKVSFSGFTSTTLAVIFWFVVSLVLLPKVTNLVFHPSVQNFLGTLPTALAITSGVFLGMGFDDLNTATPRTWHSAVSDPAAFLDGTGTTSADVRLRPHDDKLDVIYQVRGPKPASYGANAVFTLPASKELAVEETPESETSTTFMLASLFFIGCFVAGSVHGVGGISWAR
jgi:hypothetical protein